MPTRSINQVVAQNLAYWMEQAGGMTQTALAAKSGVSQKTISNYLHPEQREPSATGKQPSAKLTELDQIAHALAIDTWQLIREIKPSERKMYNAIEKAFAELMASAPNGDDV